MTDTKASPLPITSVTVRAEIDKIRAELRQETGRKVTYNEVAERLVAAYRQQSTFGGAS
jgi:hypothetical protein